MCGALRPGFRKLPARPRKDRIVASPIKIGRCHQPLVSARLSGVNYFVFAPFLSFALQRVTLHRTIIPSSAPRKFQPPLLRIMGVQQPAVCWGLFPRGKHDDSQKIKAAAVPWWIKA